MNHLLFYEVCTYVHESLYYFFLHPTSFCVQLFILKYILKELFEMRLCYQCYTLTL